MLRTSYPRAPLRMVSLIALHRLILWPWDSMEHIRHVYWTGQLISKHLKHQQAPVVTNGCCKRKTARQSPYILFLSVDVDSIAVGPLNIISSEMKHLQRQSEVVGVLVGGVGTDTQMEVLQIRLAALYHTFNANRVMATSYASPEVELVYYSAVIRRSWDASCYMRCFQCKHNVATTRTVLSGIYSIRKSGPEGENCSYRQP
jgi:hypothetical protein